jgi:hypothetical protein
LRSSNRPRVDVNTRHSFITLKCGGFVVYT